MKKKSLRLQRETIRPLTTSKMAKVVGARSYLQCTDGSQFCSGSCNNCTISCTCGTDTGDCV